MKVLLDETKRTLMKGILHLCMVALSSFPYISVKNVFLQCVPTVCPLRVVTNRIPHPNLAILIV